MSNNFFYKLGHQPQLSLTEIQFMSQPGKLEFNSDWLVTDVLIDINLTGSLVFSGKILTFWNQNESQTKILIDLEALVNTANQESQKFKKIGICTPSFLGRNVLKFLKKAGCKKINLIDHEKIPTFGNFLHTKNWLIFFRMKDKIYLGEINNYFDQDLWAKLDWNLPEKDMHRGMINLKLARTLMNFTNSKKIWDPFCGYGRNLIAGIDLKNSLIASDLDEKCLAPTQKNFQYSQEFFSLKRLTKGKKLALLKNVFQADVKEFGHLKKIESLNLVHYNKISTEIEKEIKQNLVEMVGEEDKLSDRQKIQSVKFEENFEKLAIVTEGYLGKNFSFLPSSQDVEKEFNIIEKIWLKALKNFEKLEISEIVFCLPFYKIQKRIFLPEFYSQLITGTGYKFEMLDKTNNKGYLLYSRKESIVGHFILKVCL